MAIHKDRIIVIVSADTEWNILRELIPNPVIHQSPYGEWFEHIIKVGDSVRSVNFFQGGWGKISAAASAQHVIDYFKPEIVINIGTCGGFEGRIERGDIILAEKTVVYDIEEKMGDHAEHIRHYTTVADLSWLTRPYPIPVIPSVLVSADRDLEGSQIEGLAAEYGASAGDWESGAIAWVMKKNRVKCLILKGVSDLVNTGGGEAYQGIEIYVHGARKVMKTLLESLPGWLACITPSHIFFEIHSGLEREAPGSNAETRNAFKLLPPMTDPEVLDIGCGPGAQTLELACLTPGRITAVDTHQPFLDRLEKDILTKNLAGRVTTLNRSMDDLPFPPESFDLIWSEGAIYNMGLETGLTAWRRLLKPGGCIVLTEAAWLKDDPPSEIYEFWSEEYPEMGTRDQNRERIVRSGFEILGEFPLKSSSWQEGYYGPLSARIETLEQKYRNQPDLLKILQEERHEIRMYEQYGEYYGYVFYVIQKI